MAPVIYLYIDLSCQLQTYHELKFTVCCFRSASSWLYNVPWGLRKLLNFIRRNYGDPEILITENGWSDDGGDTVNDNTRIWYLSGYIRAMRQGEQR